MLFSKKINLTILVLFFLSAYNLNSQTYNTEVEAKIYLESNNDMVKISGSAYNKTVIDKSLRFVLSVIRTDDMGNRSKNDQNGRFVLTPNEKKANLSQTTINISDKDRVIILLLIYDLDDNIVGKDRIVLNDNKSEEEVKSEINNTLSESLYAEDVKIDKEDGVILKGVVIEETVTKPGRDFYQMFYSTYNLNEINGDKIVTIKEIFALGTNTKIQVKVEDQVVIEFFVRPQNDFLKSMSDASIRAVASHFQRLKNEANIIKRY